MEEDTLLLVALMWSLVPNLSHSQRETVASREMTHGGRPDTLKVSTSGRQIRMCKFIFGIIDVMKSNIQKNE